MKRCTLCGAEKPAEEFHRDRTKPDGRRSRCKACTNAADRKRYNAEKRRRWDLARRYGITPEEWEAMHAAQGGVCCICRKPTNRTLNVDHSHTTGAVRGLLCSDCNLALGLMKEDPETLARAAIYIAQYKGPTP